MFEQVKNGYKGNTRNKEGGNDPLDHWVFNSADELIAFLQKYLKEDWTQDE